MDKWYYMSGGERLGPVALQQLRELIADGTVSPDDFVWHSGLGKEWARAGDVQELAAAAPEAAPQKQGLKLAPKPAEDQPTGSVADRNAGGVASALASQGRPAPRPRGQGLLCPHCSRPLFKDTSAWVQRLGGVVGFLVVRAFQGHKCPSCGKIKLRDLPPGDRVRVLMGGCGLIALAFFIIVALLVLMAVLGYE